MKEEDSYVLGRADAEKTKNEQGNKKIKSLYEIAVAKIARQLPIFDVHTCVGDGCDDILDFAKQDILKMQLERAETLGKNFFYIARHEMENACYTLKGRQLEALAAFNYALEHKFFNLHDGYDVEILTKEELASISSECLFHLGRSRNVRPDMVAAEFLNKKFQVGDMVLALSLLHLAKGWQILNCLDE